LVEFGAVETSSPVAGFLPSMTPPDDSGHFPPMKLA